MKTLTQFPPAWLWLVDEAIPTWVKDNYSPRESWKGKPFTKEDSLFFFKGIEELSQLFTEERPKGMPAYFLHPKFRSSYLLYFFPLQAAKFLTVFQLHSQAIDAALQHAQEKGVFRIADIGTGPGTASLSLLLLLLNQKIGVGKQLPPVELEWFDTNETIMADGKTLVEQLASSFPKLRGRVKVNTHTIPWWKAPSKLIEDTSLVLIGHLLNESSAPQSELPIFWERLLTRAQGGGTLMVEPAGRRSSQILSQIRDHMIQSELIENTPTRIWGPCLHSGNCPLATGRDWCHFSVPVEIPGRWFKDFSHSLGSERHWVKFSYLWITSKDFPAPLQNAKVRRVISDPLSQAPKSTVLICEPDEVGRFPVDSRDWIGRGDLVKLK